MLRKLSNEAVAEVTESYRKGDDPQAKEKRERWREEYTTELESNINLQKFNKAVDKTIEKFDPGDASADKFIAQKVHQALDLNRREALNPQIWNYLTLVERPDYVRHRFTSCAENRFIAKNNLNRNVFSRLWWLAEISSKDNKYKLTRKLFGDQNLANYLTDSRLGRIEPIVRPLIKISNSLESTEDVKKLGMIVTSILSTRAVETLSEEEIEELIVEEIEDKGLIEDDDNSKTLRDRFPF